MIAYEYAPASEPKFTRPSEVQEAITELMFCKAQDPNVIPNRALKHLPKRGIKLITILFNALLRMQYFAPAWKDARVISILKPGKDSILPSSHRPISVLDMFGKLFEKILLTMVLTERAHCAA
jgi:hypothetical protein